MENTILKIIAEYGIAGVSLLIIIIIIKKVVLPLYQDNQRLHENHKELALTTQKAIDNNTAVIDKLIQRIDGLLK